MAALPRGGDTQGGPVRGSASILGRFWYSAGAGPPSLEPAELAEPVDAPSRSYPGTYGIIRTMSDETENDVRHYPSAAHEAEVARREVTEVAESAAEALGAVQRILQRLLRSAHLAEEERQSSAKDLELLESQVQWFTGG